MLRESRLTEDDFRALADKLVERCGPDAVYWADMAIEELDAQGEEWRAAAWRTLRVWVLDRLGGAVCAPPALAH